MAYAAKREIFPGAPTPDEENFVLPINLKSADAEDIIPYVESLLEEFEGRTVVTSDHGNLINERVFPVPMRVWGHPKGIHVEQLIKVPWLVYEAGNRKEIIAEDYSRVEQTVDEEVVNERLANLGYV